MQSYLGKYVGKVRRETAALTDQRVHIVNETISGIVATKMCVPLLPPASRALHLRSVHAFLALLFSPCHEARFIPHHGHVCRWPRDQSVHHG